MYFIHDWTGVNKKFCFSELFRLKCYRLVFNEIDEYLSNFLGGHFIILASCDNPEFCRYSGNNEFGFAFLKFLIKKLAFFTFIAVIIACHLEVAFQKYIYGVYFAA